MSQLHPHMKLTAISVLEALFHITLCAGAPWKPCRVNLHWNSGKPEQETHSENYETN